MKPQFEGLELTPKMADVVQVFLADPAERRYGFEIMRATGQPSGTLYPILARLERAGWLVGGKEDIDPQAEGRPARRYYQITGTALPVARSQLAALSARYRPPARIRPRLRTESGAL